MRNRRKGERALALMAKEPQPGKVKTRLAKIIGDELAHQIYLAFLKDTVFKMMKFATSYPQTRLFLFHDGPESSFLMEGLSLEKFHKRLQTGKDLGERLSNAAQELLSPADQVVIIGADSPTLPFRFVESAFDLLAQNPVVLGPSFDGGYYLIGLTQLYLGVFRDISWSTSAVFAETVRKVSSRNLALGVLPPWYDVDDVNSLRFLRAHLEALSHQEDFEDAKNTRKLLEKSANWF